jgi:DMSO/TMAO reductase YedYZ molybdopterin-dependent catalytic subunit
MPIFGDDGGKARKREQSAGGRQAAARLVADHEVAGIARGLPRFNAVGWDFKIDGLVEEPLRLTWEEFRALPQVEVISDFHCVTRWSRLDNRFRWKGARFTEVLKRVKMKTGVAYVLVLAEEGYTSNVPLQDLERPDVLFAFEHDGEPLPVEHGGPLRLVVPQLYAWKSVKWVRGLTLLDHDQLGFWERNGYHAYGDPWKEQRYSGT